MKPLDAHAIEVELFRFSDKQYLRMPLGDRLFPAGKVIVLLI